MSATQRIHVRVPFRRPVETAPGEWTWLDSWIARHKSAAGPPQLGEGPTHDDVIPVEWPVELAGRTVPVNAFVGGGPLAEVVRRAEHAAAAGFGTVKLKIGFEESTEELRGRVGDVRKAIGRDVKLRLDANGAWSVDDALERLRAVWDFDIEFVEQPISASEGVTALAVLRAKSPIEIAADESVVSVDAARRLLDEKAADMLVVKPSRVGGPFIAADILEVARNAGVPVVMSTAFETGVGISVALALAANLPEGPAHGLATADLLESDLLRRPLEVREGRMIVPETVELDDRALDRYTVERRGEWP